MKKFIFVITLLCLLPSCSIFKDQPLLTHITMSKIVREAISNRSNPIEAAKRVLYTAAMLERTLSAGKLTTVTHIMNLIRTELGFRAMSTSDKLRQADIEDALTLIEVAIASKTKDGEITPETLVTVDAIIKGARSGATIFVTDQP